MASSEASVRSDYLSVVISSSLTSFGAQKRFPVSITIGELKVRGKCTGILNKAHLPYPLRLQRVIQYPSCHANTHTHTHMYTGQA